MKLKLGLLATLLCVVNAAHADSVRDTMQQIGSIVARVGDVWEKDARYEAFHKELSGKFSDTPALEQFKSDESWVVVTSSKSVMYAGIFRGRSKATMNLKVGDIVEMRISDYKNVKSYAELSEVTKVLCKTGSAEYDECVKNNPLSWIDKGGNRLVQPR